MQHPKEAPANKTCFVIAPIDAAGSEIRKRSDQILKHIIGPASKTCGYGEPIRSDKIAEVGMITTQIIQHLLDDAMVVADLTGENPNVFYELAIRHAFKKPVIQLIQSGQRIPFDVGGLRTVEVDHHDLDSVAQATDSLIQHMNAIQKNPNDVESPVSIAVDREALRKGTSQERELAQVLDTLAKLGQVLVNVEKKVNALAVTGLWKLTSPPGQFNLHDIPPVPTGTINFELPVPTGIINFELPTGESSVKATESILRRIPKVNLKSEGEDDKS